MENLFKDAVEARAQACLRRNAVKEAEAGTLLDTFLPRGRR